MENNLNNVEQENGLINNKFIHNLISVLLAISPILGGFYLLWGFLLFIGRPDIFQAIISDTVTPIIISIAFLVYMFAVLITLYLPCIVFSLYFYLYKIIFKEAIDLSVNKLIIRTFFSSILFMILININSYLYIFWKIEIPSYAILICFILYLIILFIYYQKDKSIFIVVSFSSLTCVTPFWLILNFMTGGESILSLIILLSLCLVMLIIQYFTLYFIYNVSFRRHLLYISILAIMLVTILYSSFTNIFYRAYQVFYIIDKNEYNLIINKNDYSEDVFNDNEWLLEESPKDKNVYHVKGERLFNLSKTVLFCPKETFDLLKKSATYNIDTLKTDASPEKLKNKVNKCVLLDTNKVTFHKLLPENKSEQQ